MASCRNLMAQVCAWYTNGRERDKAGALFVTSSLLEDFADFPIYCLDMSESGSRMTDESKQDLFLVCTGPMNRYPSSIASYQKSTLNGTTYPNWLTKLLQVIDIDNWFKDLQDKRADFYVQRPPYETAHNIDFDVRAQSLNLILYLYVKSVLALEEHSAMIVRKSRTSYDNIGNM